MRKANKQGMKDAFGNWNFKRQLGVGGKAVKKGRKTVVVSRNRNQDLPPSAHEHSLVISTEGLNQK